MNRTSECPSCRRELFPDDVFCSKCGTRVQAAMTRTGQARRTELRETLPPQDRQGCGSCNSPLLPSEVFCPACGARSGGTAPDARPADEMRASILRRLKDATRGEFEFIRELGRGGMGTVYLAREKELDRLVAIKALSSNWLSDESMVERFRREARTIASLRHPSIVHVHSVGRVDDIHYFIMDFIDGVSLGQMLRNHGPMSIPAIHAILYQVGSALSYAHRPARGVIHRDVKPSNIMVDEEGNAFVTDFGISKVTEGQSGLTMTGLIMGTPEYMSPEQCRGDRATYGSDQYALGVVVYALLTGSPPFTGPHYRVLTGHTSEPPPPITELRPDCPRDLANVVYRMLAKPPGERWPDIKDAMRAAGVRPLMPDDPARDEMTEVVALTRRILTQRQEARTEHAETADSESGSRRPTLLRILALPQSLEAGDEVRLRATACFDDGEEVESDVSWQSTDPSIARIDPDTGQLVAVGAGSAVITARSAGIAESVAVEVRPPRVTGLRIEPEWLEIEIGATAQPTAEALGRRDEVLDRPVLWSSSDPGIATVSEQGVIRAHRLGSATLLAHCEGVGAAAEVTVIPATVATIQFVGAPAAVSIHESAALRVDVRDARGDRLERPVTWAISDEAVATISDSGELHALTPGPVRVTAQSGGAVATAEITITPAPVARVVIQNPPGMIRVEEAITLEARTFDSRGEELNRPVNWIGGEGSVVALEPDGSIRGLEAGETTVAAVCEGVVSRIRIEVRPIPVDRVVLSPPPTELVVGDTFHMDASPQDDRERPLDRAVVWKIDDATVLQALGEGRFRAVAPGETSVFAEADGVAALVRLEVSPLRAASVVLDLVPAGLDVDDQVTLAAQVRDQRGGILEKPLEWSSSNSWIARVSGDGVVTAAAPGTATITVECDGVTDSVEVTVSTPPWATKVAAAYTQESVEETAMEAAPAEMLSDELPPDPADAGEPTEVWVAPSQTPVEEEPGLDRRRLLLWGVPSAVVVVGGALWAILSSGGGRAAPPVDPVLPPAVADIEVVTTSGEPVAGLEMLVGDTLALRARVTDTDGNPVQAAAVAWTGAPASLAEILGDGRVVAREPGTLSVAATFENFADSVSLAITRRPAQPPPGPVVVSVQLLTAAGRPIGAGGLEMTVGETLRLNARPLDANGDAIDASANWSGSPANLASVSPGRIVARVPGTLTVTASVDGVAGRVSVVIRAPPEPPPPAPNGHLRLVIYPPSQILIDGATMGERRTLLQSLTPGPHQLRIINANMAPPLDTTWTFSVVSRDTTDLRLAPIRKDQ